MLNWRTEALETLTLHNARKQSLQSIETEINRLELELMDIRRASSAESVRDEQTLNNLVKRGELSRARMEAELWIRATEDALAALTPQEKQLLEQLYISPRWGSVCQLVRQTGYAKTTIYRKRNNALRKFTVALYGKV